MRTSIRDRETLQALRPLDMLAYLRTSGWHRDAEIEDKASVWLHGEADILVPLRRDVADFALRAGEFLGTLERVEGRAQEAILRDVLCSSADLVRIRAFTSGNSTDGTIPLSTGVGLVEPARELLGAAACAAVSPRPYWARRRPAQATEFLNDVRMGQTERGSYVLTMLCPVTPALTAEGADGEEEIPFERRVTQMLGTAVRAAVDAARHAAESGSVAPFREAMPLGVSANLCDALSGLER